MKIKKYEVTDMKEALKLIKQDLGPDAVILTTRKIMKPAGLGLFPKPILEVTAAIDYEKPAQGQEEMPYLPPDPTVIRSQSAPQRRPQPLQQGYPAPVYNQAAQPVQPSAYPYKQNSQEQAIAQQAAQQDYSSKETNFTRALLENRKRSALEPVQEVHQPAQAVQLVQTSQPVQVQKNFQQPQIQQPVQQSFAQPADNAESLAKVLSSMGLASLATDITDIKRQLNDMKASIQEPVNMTVDLAPNLRDVYTTVIKNGLDELLAYRFLKGIEKSLPDTSSKAQIKSLLTEKIAEAIPIEDNYLNIIKGKVMGFVGPTGVGKTTTIAKIAAELVLKHTQKVCLITVDNFRVGAVEQLKTYAEIVNLPLYVASSPADLERLLTNVSGQYEYILLDSTGRSPYDMNKLNEAAQYLNAHEDIVPILVLSMAANHAELGEMYERYSGLDPQYIVFTKLDETRYFGPLANLPMKKKIPLMLFSIGQSVPDDLEIPDGKKIAKKLLQEIPVLWNDN